MSYFLSGILIVVVIFLIIILSNYFNYKKRQSYVDRHERYIVILDHYMQKAFEIIYKDRILIYSIEGTKPDDEIIKRYSIDFAKLTLQLLGSNLTKEFIYLYGNEQSFMFTLIEFFNSRSENDEIKEASINQIVEGSDDEII